MLLDLIQNDGLNPKRKTPKEYASACPHCGGSDRFLIFLDTNQFWCRQCGINGDAIQYMRDFHGMNYADAANAAGKEVVPFDRATTLAIKTPKKEQPAEWQTAARDLISCAIKNITGDVLEWLLRERGITEQTARAFSLGWLPGNTYQNKSAWGLDDGKKLFVPSGLVVPWQDKRIRIRRNDPGDYGRYHAVNGSSAEPFSVGEPCETAAIIVESELDAILLSQEIKRKIFIVSMGSATIKPDNILLEKLEQCPVVLVAMDSDKAGGKAAQWWLDNVSSTCRTLTPKAYGKDVTEAFLNGLELNKWLSVSMELACEEMLNRQGKKDGQWWYR